MTRRYLLLSLGAGLASGAEKASPAAGKTITAGPFKVICPARWAEGAVVKKTAALPVYSAEEQRARKAFPLSELKPSNDNRPEHWAIHLPSVAVRNADSDSGEITPEIFIHKSEGWAGIYEDGASDPAARQKKVAELRAQLEEMSKNETAFAYPAYMDAHFDFLALKRRLNFKGGWGLRMVGQWDVEPSLLSERLHYLFVGLSDDGSCQIIATFPLRVEGLTKISDANASHLGFDLNDYETLSRKFDVYEKKAVDWLRNQEGLLMPKLKELDALLESLEARTWVD